MGFETEKREGADSILRLIGIAIFLSDDKEPDMTTGSEEKGSNMKKTSKTQVNRNTKRVRISTRILTMVLTFVMAAGVLAGCGKQDANVQDTLIRIGSMKGPTSMGLLSLKEKSENGEAAGQYEFNMYTAADEILPLMIKGELDIALVPANVASILYNKTEGAITVIDINTLGVLYMVSGNTEITSMADLKGKTIYLTGKGTTPDYVLNYLLDANGMAAECTLEYKSEATEVAAVLAQNPDAIGLLPQPFVTAACAQNEALSVALSMNEEWEKLQGEDGSRMVTGVTVVRDEFLEANQAAVQNFMKEHEESAAAINADVEKGAQLVVAAEIIAKEPIAKKAIPACNITYIDGKDMKQALLGYLGVLAQQSPEAVGGVLPGDDFYYVYE